MSNAFNQMLAQGPTPIKFADPINQMAQLMQLKNAQQTGVVNQMAIDKGQREITQKNALNAAYRGNIDSGTGKINFPGVSQYLASSGQGELVPDILKQKQEYETGQSTAAKAQNDRIVSTLALSQDALSRIVATAPDAGAQVSSIFSGVHQDSATGAWLDSLGQTEEKTLAAVDDAVRKCTLPAFIQQSLNSAKSIQDRFAKSPYGKTTQMVGSGGPGVYQQNAQTGEYTMVGGIPQTAAQQTAAQGATAGAEDSGRAASIANYEAPPLGAMEMRTPYGRALMAQVRAANPDYKAYNYKVVSDAVNRFSTGKQGDSVRSISVAMDHLSTLEDAVAALGNNDTKALNRVGNYLQEQFGLSVAPTDFAAIKPLVVDEVLKAVVAGAGGVTDREELGKTLNAASSPAILLNSINRFKELMGGQLQGLERQYAGASGLDDFESRILQDQPEAVALLKKHKGKNSSGRPSAANDQAIPEGATATGPNGQQIIVKGGQWQPVP